MMTSTKMHNTLHPPKSSWKFYVLALFLSLLLFSMSNCSREEKSKKYPVFYDFVQNFHLAEVQQEVRLIDFGTPTARRHLKSGFSGDEKKPRKKTTFVWGIGEKSILEFFLSETREIQMVFRCSPFQFPDSPVQVISITVNGKEIGKVTLEPGLKEYQIVLPSHVLKSGKNRLEFSYAYARVPRKVKPGARDNRLLAVFWDYIRFGTGEEQTLSEASADAQSREIYIPFGFQVDYFLLLPVESVITFDNLTFIGNSESYVRLALQREGEEEQVIGNLHVSEKLRAIPLPGDPGQIVRLSFRAVSSRQGPTDSEGVKLVNPVIRTQHPQETLWGSRRPNVIIYLIDALRADHLGCYGYDKPISPNIDAFARDATLFENAIAQSSWTRPTVASIFTGLCPRAHGTNDINDALPAEATTLAELLRAAGYNTAAFNTNSFVTSTFGFDQGFIDFASTENSTAPFFKSDEVNNQVFAWLDRESRKQPFFLYVHTLDPHEPYAPPTKFRERFASQVRQPEIGFSPWRALNSKKIPMTKNILEDLVLLYDAEIAFNDYNFGLFLRELKRRGLYEESLIIFVSDHGEEFFENDRLGHRNNLYKEVLDIPMIVKLPSSYGTVKKRVPHLAQHIDILPTILDYIGLEIPDHVEGSSLLTFLSPGEDEMQPRRAFSFLEFGGRHMESVVEGPWKLIRQRRSEKHESGLELYNHNQDPGENVNVLEKYPEIVENLLSVMKSHEHHNRTMKPNKVVIDEELKEKLKALGYLQ